MNQETFLSFVRAVYDNPQDHYLQMVFADWLDEQGLSGLASDLRNFRQSGIIFGHGDGYIAGHGDGYGYEDGDGDDDESIRIGESDDGVGVWYRNERGDGYEVGYRNGYGEGDGNGYGDGYEDVDLFRKLQEKDTTMVKGKNYLFMSGYGWAWVGEYVGPNGLGTHAIKSVSNLCRTGGASWFHLAKGQNRNGCVVRVIDGEVTIPTPIAIPWAGEVFKQDQN